MVYTTGKKYKIIDLLSSDSARSFTLEDICREILADGRGRSTVYRIVSELVADGVLRRISDGRTRHCTYQFIGGEKCRGHLHLKCSECGRLIHLDDDISHELCDRLLSIGGFLIESDALIRGKCKECAG